MSVDELKAQGNAAFKEQRYQESIDFFTKAIEIDGSNHVLYSNRSASKASIHEYEGALEDALKVIEIKPDWPKGYSRKGAALVGLKRQDEAVEAFDEGLKIDPTNQMLLDGKAQAQSQPQGGGGLGNLFGDLEQMKAKLAANPETKDLAEDESFLSMLQMGTSNPQMMGMLFQNPKFMKAFGVLSGIDMQFAGPGAAGADGPAAADTAATGEQASKEPEGAQARDMGGATVNEVTEEDDEDAEGKKAREAATAEKLLGNAAYKKKDFEVAIGHYNKAIELYDKDVSFITNRAAVHLEKGEYDKCIQDCDTAVEKGRELRVDYKIIAKALTRKGVAMEHQGDMKGAIEMYNKALTENRNPDTLGKLKAAEKKLRENEKNAYVDLEKAEESRQKGNECFSGQQYPDAVKHYQEALKRGPPDRNPDAYKIYSNLAATYTKLTELSEGLKAANKCIELKPEFAKGYSRKGHIQFFMKEFEGALETYNTGLKYEPDNEELKEGVQRCRVEMMKFMTGEATEEEIKERQARAMENPEIQNILRDPQVQMALSNMQNDPASFSQYMSDPMMSMKIQKLITAGVIQVGQK